MLPSFWVYKISVALVFSSDVEGLNWAAVDFQFVLTLQVMRESI